MNELGKTKIMRYVYEESLQNFKYVESEEMPLQRAFDKALDIFESEYQDEKNLWDSEITLKWAHLPATEKQLALIKAKLSEQEWQSLMGIKMLTKSDAGQIISLLNLRNLKLSDLLRMRRKQQEIKKEKQELKQSINALKIRKCFDKQKRTFKYYAIQHPTDLIITNSWEMAKDIISALNGVSGADCRYKSFVTLKEAEEFLRKTY
jgi:hypothetical protein